MAENERKMEGWLYLIRFNRFGLLYSRKRYFILEDNCLKSFKSIPSTETEEPVRSAIIDSCIRVTDNGRESHRRKVFFIFTLYNSSNHNDQLKLGATSSEEAARWIHCLQDAALKPVKNSEDSSRRIWQPYSFSNSKRESTIDRTSASAMHVAAMSSDVIAPPPWKIFGCQNGLRLFREAKYRDSKWKDWDDHPAIMAVGVIDGTPEAVFSTLMSLGPSRTEWDFCFYRGSVVEHLDGHKDIVHIQLYNNWLPRPMKRRDLLLQRYWRRENDGTYVILYHTVFHRNCPPKHGYVRARLKSGGFVITPAKQGKECVVKHMLAIDWRIWTSYLRKTSARSITIRMLGRVAALRELFRAKAGYGSYEYLSGELTKDIWMPQREKEVIKTEVDLKRTESKTKDESEKPVSGSSSLGELNDAEDEFFDVLEPSDDDQPFNGCSVNTSPELCYTDKYQPKLSSAAFFVRKLHDIAVQRKGYTDLLEMSQTESVSCSYGDTLPKDSSFNKPCSWAAADPSPFSIRGDGYLEDHRKIRAEGTLMEMVAADWLRSVKREDNLAGRPGGIVQRYADQGGPEFFFIVNIQVPGTTTYNLALYYMLENPLHEIPLLDSFVSGDDAFRNSRFKLIPYISEGPWIVKQSVRKKPCLIGQALEIRYFQGNNYLEVDIDVGSSTVASRVVSLVLGYLKNLVIEIAFLIQGDTPEELPEFLLGTCRLNHLDASKSVSADSISIR
ncbi:ENHANCED DISEASE RESISTANCE 2-like [Olea europaea subsp. europaea]|uniref:ENHANCED DISEASE RESISTANCE 2-like n=1 Tax=Olea europaea subsp. europaea TaxID=158383 RepID=A0A8S0UHD8_OLEEU|nr:ENHANCED DISEASE RESISTANCE 2-like [Olea europaea subsp. europaea]